VSAPRIIALGVVIALIILSTRAVGAIEAFGAKADALVQAPQVASERRPVASMPVTFVLNLASGGSFICRLADGGYSCTPAPVRDAVHGSRS
jgi:hypothetical protein